MARPHSLVYDIYERASKGSIHEAARERKVESFYFPPTLSHMFGYGNVQWKSEAFIITHLGTHSGGGL